MSSPIGVLTPAYGRDYKSKAEVVAAFEAGKDFTLNSPWNTTLCSIRDFGVGQTVQIRYAKLSKVLTHKVKSREVADGQE
jgi:hypothetical protein